MISSLIIDKEDTFAEELKEGPDKEGPKLDPKVDLITENPQ